MASKFAVEVELKSNPQKVWERINDYTNFFPKAFPQVFESVVALKGDGNSPGSVRLIKYGPEVPLKTITEKIELVDEENKKMSYSVIDGDILKLYTVFKATMEASSKGDGTLVTYSGEYERLNEQVPHPDNVTGFILNALLALDAYLLSKNEKS
ncbi:MLP-like protein 423 [Dorcoceras hygrometricum]|uniref:MLP-like protein 423 n=1 Tax=Dorcoceras hygrometricum TaxID=472368 RepID=A0A2Z7D0J6_9LAMI|nr:MLP-like protein 423 [Dorcoceras hygrometricum]